MPPSSPQAGPLPTANSEQSRNTKDPKNRVEILWDADEYDAGPTASLLSEWGAQWRLPSSPADNSSTNQAKPDAKDRRIQELEQELENAHKKIDFWKRGWDEQLGKAATHRANSYTVQLKYNVAREQITKLHVRASEATRALELVRKTEQLNRNLKEDHVKALEKSDQIWTHEFKKLDALYRGAAKEIRRLREEEIPKYQNINTGLEAEVRQYQKAHAGTVTKEDLAKLHEVLINNSWPYSLDWTFQKLEELQQLTRENGIRFDCDTVRFFELINQVYTEEQTPLSDEIEDLKQKHALEIAAMKIRMENSRTVFRKARTELKALIVDLKSQLDAVRQIETPMTKDQHVNMRAHLLEEDPKSWEGFEVDDLERIEELYLEYGINLNRKSVGFFKFVKEQLQAMEAELLTEIGEIKTKHDVEIKGMKKNSDNAILKLQNAAKKCELDYKAQEDEADFTIDRGMYQLEKAIEAGEENAKIARTTIDSLEQEILLNDFVISVEKDEREEVEAQFLAYKESVAAALEESDTTCQFQQTEIKALNYSLELSEKERHQRVEYHQNEVIWLNGLWTKTHWEKKEAQRLLALERAEVAQLLENLATNRSSYVSKSTEVEFQMDEKDDQVDLLGEELEKFTPGEDLTGEPEVIHVDDAEWTEVEMDSDSESLIPKVSDEQTEVVKDDEFGYRLRRF